MKSILVTGASTGIGEACALDLDRHGHKVYAGVRRSADGDQLASKASDRLVPVILDVTDQATIDAAAKRISEESGNELHGLVNNAGIGRGGPLEFLELDEWREQLEVNVVGQVAVTKSMLGLIRSGHGRIVFIGSIGGKVATMMMGPYNASKFAIEGIGEALRHELHPWGINVAVVEPGAIRTEIWSKATETADQLEASLSAEALSLYGRLMASMRKALQMQTRNAVPAQKAADAVRHALFDPRPRTRYLVGRDARAMSAMVRLLPDRAREALVRRVAGP
ncbi:MAG TPA: SDR family oxidoreductase [Acidimicrobiales bacterium]|nr:SDR family oxidoreductase [Acidimicrobiales bacterium]